MLRPASLLLSSLSLLAAAAPRARGNDTDTQVPGNLVLDVRLYEARSTRPDFQTMDDLSFFIDTDGKGVTEAQWLATILRKTPDSTLATLACETLPVAVSAGGGAGGEQASAHFQLSKRSRTLDVGVDLKEFSEKGTFPATARFALRRGDEVLRSFDREIELRLGQTYVWGSRNLEISASDYLSHFRDFQNTKDRGALYESLRNYTFFLVVAVTSRLAEGPAAEPVVVAPNESVSLEKLQSPLGIPLEGRIVVELTLDDAGIPTDAHIVRSSVPELNPFVLGEASEWRFPEASGKKARLSLELHASP